ncbi:TraY domain-containing protein [Vibrio parahaemolyticus]|nr:TraY domain-containing protein [Vibrio parahaemolyticus]EGQ9147788.1 conjugal transfer protein TraY [Vibrio parahaemolyticus]EGR0987914.1 TraY domain-containing protein [Vibrio parahaemolyticus]EGR1374235.1 TraY domain-containing protein [Vibrio parahaemolyticus]EHY8973431.1 TraY domain-containing protein [Vibrio parahaemolyticus]
MSNEPLSSLDVLLDKFSAQALENTAALSFRTLRKEASSRVIDHVQRHPERCEQSLYTRKKEVRVDIDKSLKSRLCPLLYTGTYKTKTQLDECSRRIKGHLLRSPTISAVGVVQERKHAS